MANPIIDGIARLLLCLVFVHAVVGKLIGFQATSTMMTVRGLPLAPLLLILAMILMAVGSALVISGWRRRLGAILLLVFLVPTTLIFHTELAQPDQRIALSQEPGHHGWAAPGGQPAPPPIGSVASVMAKPSHPRHPGVT